MTSRRINVGMLLLRLAVGGLMLFHGFAKMMPGGLAGIKSLLGAHNLPTLFAYGALVGEVVAPLMIVIGFRTRAAALVVAVNMVVAVLLAHSGDIAAVGGSGGYALELQALYLLGSLVLAITGAGRCAVSHSSKFD